MLRKVKEANRQGTKHKKASNQNKLILLLKSIFHRVVHDQRRDYKQEHKVYEDENGSDPLSVEDLIELIHSNFTRFFDLLLFTLIASLDILSIYHHEHVFSDALSLINHRHAAN